MSLYPLLSSPVPIKPVPSAENLGFIGLLYGAIGTSQFHAPIQYKNAMYIISQEVGATPEHVIFIARSAIGGLNWQTVDKANGPMVAVPPCAGAFYDGLHTVTVAYSPTADQITPVLGTVQLQDFDLDTGTWGPIYATAGAPSCYTVGPVFKRPAGDFIVLLSDTAGGGFITGLKAAVYTPSSATWGASFSIDTGLTGGYTSDPTATALVDSVGRLHVFSLAVNGAARRSYYQQIETDNSLGTFVIIESSAGNISSPSCQPATDGTSIVIGGLDASGRACAFVGTPLSAPVFTTEQTIDSITSSPGNSNTAPVFAYGPKGWYAAYRTPTPGTGFNEQFNVRIGQSPLPGSGWSWITGFTSTTQVPYFGPDFFGLSVLNPGTPSEALQVVSDGLRDNLGGPEQPILFYLGVAVVPIEIILTGVKRYQEATSAPPIVQVTPTSSRRLR